MHLRHRVNDSMVALQIIVKRLCLWTPFITAAQILIKVYTSEKEKHKFRTYSLVQNALFIMLKTKEEFNQSAEGKDILGRESKLLRGKDSKEYQNAFEMYLSREITSSSRHGLFGLQKEFKGTKELTFMYD